MGTIIDSERSVRAYIKACSEYDAGVASGADADAMRLLKQALRVARINEKARTRAAGSLANALYSDAKVADESGTAELNSLQASPAEIAKMRSKAAVTIITLGAANKTMLPDLGSGSSSGWMAAPEIVVRGPLFGVNVTTTTTEKTPEGKQRRVIKRVHYSTKGLLCVSVGDAALRYHGEALDQGDFDVWMYLLHLARNDLTKPLDLRLRNLLEELGRGTSGKDYKALSESLKRLAFGQFSYQRGQVFAIKDHKLLRDLTIDEKPGIARVVIHAEMARLFGSEKGLSWTRIQREQRQALSGNHLALWLHAFYSSHAKPIPLTLKKLQECCGSQLPPGEFKRMLLGSTKKDGGTARVRKGALQALVDSGFLQKGYTINEKMKTLSVTRNHEKLSSSQARAAKD